MENTIMTEKIARRGIYTPDSYEPDVLRKMTVSQVIKRNLLVLSSENTIGEIRNFFDNKPPVVNHFLVVNKNGSFDGAISLSGIYKQNLNPESSLSAILKRNLSLVKSNENLAKAVEIMSASGDEFLPVISSEDGNNIIGMLTYKDVLTAYKLHFRENQEKKANLSLKRQRIKILIKGRKLISTSRITTRNDHT